jgi:hypothetical protein
MAEIILPSLFSGSFIFGTVFLQKLSIFFAQKIVCIEACRTLKVGNAGSCRELTRADVKVVGSNPAIRFCLEVKYYLYNFLGSLYFLLTICHVLTLYMHMCKFLPSNEVCHT